MHYLIVILIIAAIVIIQIRTFVGTKQKIDEFLDIFPDNSDEYQLEKEALIKKINTANVDEIKNIIQSLPDWNNIYYYAETDENGEEIWHFRMDLAKEDLINHLSTNASVISVNHYNDTLKTIVGSINDYLKNNKTVSDFHLMKDIVDRNCDAKEEEINTQIPVPLYMGLVGTMAGILIGVGILAFGGGLEALLSSDVPASFQGTAKEWAAKGSEGVIALMGGVAVAMISSILGIILTVWGSNKFKTAKSQVESNKHNFLSWIQAKLLPTLSDNVVGAIREMTGNLENFNNQFKDNTSNLGEALAKVNESYKLQTQLIDAVNKIQEGRTAATNLTLLSKLIESSEQIGQIAEYLENCNDYLANVKALNEKLDLQENRTRAIEEVGAFFKTELSEIEARKGAIAQSVGKVDDYLQRALNGLTENMQQQIDKFNVIFTKQGDILQQKSQEIEKIVAELKQLSAVKDGIAKFEKAMSAQNSKLDNLANAIQALAKAKADGTNLSNSLTPKMKPYKKLLIIFGSVVGGLALLALLALLVDNWDKLDF